MNNIYREEYTVCMKYLNTTICCYKSISKEQGKVVSLNGPFNSMSITADETKSYIEDFFIVTQFNLLGTNKTSEKELSAIESKRNIDVIIRITKLSKEENDRLGFDVDRFTIDISDIQIDLACFHYSNYNRITPIEKLSLPKGIGSYVIKVLTKFEDQKNYSVQSMYAFQVNN